jgi:hypothetical protein
MDRITLERHSFDFQLSSGETLSLGHGKVTQLFNSYGGTHSEIRVRKITRPSDLDCRCTDCLLAGKSDNFHPSFTSFVLGRMMTILTDMSTTLLPASTAAGPKLTRRSSRG